MQSTCNEGRALDPTNGLPWGKRDPACTGVCRQRVNNGTSVIGVDHWGCTDLPHFTYVGPGKVDIRSLNLKAFQRVWNRFNPDDQIEETGVFKAWDSHADTQDPTAIRLAKAPCDGFRHAPQSPTVLPPMNGIVTSIANDTNDASVSWFVIDFIRFDDL